MSTQYGAHGQHSEAEPASATGGARETLERSSLRRLGATLESNAWWVVGALVAVAAYLRFANLGMLDFRWDEDLYSLAVKGILEHGIPELPSGMVYLRGGPFLYLTAASAHLFGTNEWALRAPAALFGLGTIPLAFLFGRALFGNAVGLIVAALMVFSAWDIEFSRYARMYAPFEFLYLLTLLCIWRYRVVEKSTVGGVLCIALALLTISVHELGYSLAIAFLVPPALQGRGMLREPRHLVFPAIAFSVVAGFFFALRRTLSHYFNAAARASEPAPLEQVSSSAGGLWGMVRALGSQFDLPSLPLFSPLWSGFPLAAPSLVVGALLAATAFWYVRRASFDAASSALLAAIALSCVLQLFNVALLATLMLAFLRSEGVHAFRRPDIRFAVACIGVSFVVWMLLALGLDLGGRMQDGTTSAVKATVREMLDFPRFFVFWGFPREYPLMSIAALIGGFWAFDRAARIPRNIAALFLMIVFAVPIVLNGMFETQYQTFRYNVPFGPLYFTFVALGLTRWQQLVATWHRDRIPALDTARSTALATSVLVALVIAVDVNPLRSWLLSRHDYSNASALHRLFALPTFRDFSSPARFVAENADDGDIIIAFECREYYNYLGRLDYCVLSSTYLYGDAIIQTYVDGDGRRDLYLSTPMLMSLDELEHALQTTPGTKWLIASDSMMANPRAVSEDIRSFVRDSDTHVAYVARDGETKVYRF